MQLFELITEIKQGSRAAQQLLFDSTADRMMALCCRYLKKREDAEEAMLNGYLKVYRSMQGFSYQSDGAFQGWLKQIMVNECLMFLRKKHVFTIEAETVAEQLSVPADVFDKMDTATIRALIIQLPVGYRTVFNLYEIEGMGHVAIAEALQISEGTSKSQLSKARHLLQKLYHQQENHYAQRQAR